MSDVNLLASVSVDVLRDVAGERDAHGNATQSTTTTKTVDGVIPQPGATSDLEASRPDGVSVAVTFHFPKAYTASLRGCRIRYAGREFRVIGDPQPYLDANTPGEWNRPVECEACDG